jgi:hypothetical protein
MKKIKDFERYRRNQTRAARRSDLTRSRRAKSVANAAHGGSFRGGEQSSFMTRQTRVIVPKIFSLIENPENTLSFFERFDAACKDPYRVFIDSDQVERVTIEALLLLLAKIQGKKHRCAGIGGEEPKNEEVKKVFAQSGFYDFFATKPHGYHQQNTTGRLLKRRDGKRVREGVCADLVHYTTKKVFGIRKKNGGLYRTLIECMANTRDHARLDGTAIEPWWVAVYFDERTGIAHFAFLDTGVGIFKSARMQSFLTHLGRFVGIISNVDLLNDVLDANLGSRTNLPYRGKGLPSVKRALMRSQIRNLKLLTNDALLDASSREGKTLQRSFKGTCLTWDIHP